MSITDLLQPTGLVVLGSFELSAADQVPNLENGQPAAALMLIGNGGSSFWKAFSHSVEFLDGKDDPLDRWSMRVGNDLAVALGAKVFFPFDGPPYLPFQSWAKETGQVAPSRLSMVMHERFGLWHGYRFALALPEMPQAMTHDSSYASACLSCTYKPCLDACPVQAFKAEVFAVDQCVDYLAGDEKSVCRTLGCEARRACPVGQGFVYQPLHARFHMEAFLKSRLSA